MSQLRTGVTTVRCNCGITALELAGSPIITNVCYCDDCQEGDLRIEALPNAAPVRDADGGTPYVIYRKDRVKVAAGADLLVRHKLTEKSPTNRVVASCCNTAMMLNFDDAKHWVDVYRQRFGADAPPVDMRVCTKFRTGPGDLPNDIPSYPSFSFKFIGRLLASRLAMLMGR